MSGAESGFEFGGRVCDFSESGLHPRFSFGWNSEQKQTFPGYKLAALSHNPVVFLV